MSLHQSKKRTIIDKKQPLLDRSNDIEVDERSKIKANMNSFPKIFSYKGIELDIDFRIILPNDSFGGKYFLETYMQHEGKNFNKKLLFKAFK